MNEQSLWKRGVEKFSTGTLKFMPNVTKDVKTTSKGEDSDLTPKQRRRAQVRKAQTEHRQRKENYVKHLEQDVINLREMIAKAETQSVLFKHENIAIKVALQNQNIPLPATSISHTQVPQAAIPEQEVYIGNLENLQQDSSAGEFNPSGQDMAWIMNDSIVSTTYDPFLNGECLQISPANSFTQSTNDISMPSPDIFKLTSMHQTPPTQHQQQPSSASPRPVTTEEDLSSVAVNFILALEHPCRTHFSPPSTAPFSPTSPATGHELMATTHLFAHASSFSHPNPHPHTHPALSTHPAHADHEFHKHNGTLLLHPSVSRDDNSQQVQTGGASDVSGLETQPSANMHQPIEAPAPGSTWRVPFPTLDNLYRMSECLPKENWEITPVQAWFLLLGRYGDEKLLGRGKGGGGERAIDRLKRGLAELVACLGFGSVMDEVGFWEVVGKVMEEEALEWE